MKNVFLVSEKFKQHYLFFSNETMGSEELKVQPNTTLNDFKESLPVHEVQSGDTLSSLALSFKISENLQVNNIYHAKVRYKKNACPTQSQITRWNQKHPRYAIPQNIIKKIITGELIPLGYANFLSPGQKVSVEGLNTLVVENTPSHKKKKNVISKIEAKKNTSVVTKPDPIFKESKSTSTTSPSEKKDPFFKKSTPSSVPRKNTKPNPIFKEPKSTSTTSPSEKKDPFFKKSTPSSVPRKNTKPNPIFKEPKSTSTTSPSEKKDPFF